ncbi:MAG: hypothetical protein JHD16_10435 [Solirubrobacteraceae bacterium]|nr:hypothetical protein [Solirubrobacteraceae bacterium]
MSASADISVKQIDDFEVEIGLDDIRIKEIDDIDVGLDDIRIKELPTITLGKITAGVDPITLNPLSIAITRIPKLAIGLDPIEIKPLTVNLGPIELNLAIKEIPSVRVHLPVHLGLGLSLLGHEVLSARVAGEAQVITEPYEPNACEHCEGHGKGGGKKP